MYSNTDIYTHIYIYHLWVKQAFNQLFTGDFLCLSSYEAMSLGYVSTPEAHKLIMKLCFG